MGGIFLRLLLMAVALVSILTLPRSSLVQYWDERVLLMIHAYRSPYTNLFLLFITQLGSTLGFLLSLLGGFLYHGLQKRWQTAWVFLIGIGLWKLSVSLLKFWVGRPRPEQGLLELSTLSMPSGHGAGAVFIYGVWGVILWHKTSSVFLRSFIVFLMVAMIFLTDLSRLYFGVHYLSDVLMGNLWAAVGLYFLQGLKKDLLV